MRTTPAWRTLAVIGAVGALLVTGIAPAAAAAAIPTGNFDFRALGARIKGAVGDQAEIKIGFRNDGPTAPDRSDTGTPVTIVDVTMPTGTTAVGVPAECQLHANPNATIYRCQPGPVVAVGETITFPFTMRIDATDAQGGSVRINVRCKCDGETIDLNGGNDTAPIEINVSGGGLQLTGAAWGVIAGVGGLLVVGGVLAAVIAWRRRNRAEDEDEAQDDVGAGTGPEVQAGTAGAEIEAGAGTGPEVQTDTAGAEIEAGARTGPEVQTDTAGAEIEAGARTGAEIEGGAGTGPEVQTGTAGAEIEAGTADAEIGPGTGAGTEAGAEAGTETEAGAKAGAKAEA